MNQAGKRPRVNLRELAAQDYDACVRLELNEDQKAFVASNMKSLAQAKTNPDLVPLAIYDGDAIGHTVPPGPMIGFTVYEITDGVGFLLRLMIDRKYQRQGYGRAVVLEVVRRMRLHPEVQVVATSCQRGNVAAETLFRSLGFVDWEISWVDENPDELFLILDEGP